MCLKGSVSTRFRIPFERDLQIKTAPSWWNDVAFRSPFEYYGCMNSVFSRIKHKHVQTKRRENSHIPSIVASFIRKKTSKSYRKRPILPHKHVTTKNTYTKPNIQKWAWDSVRARRLVMLAPVVNPYEPSMTKFCLMFFILSYQHLASKCYYLITIYFLALVSWGYSVLFMGLWVTWNQF